MSPFAAALSHVLETSRAYGWWQICQDDEFPKFVKSEERSNPDCGWLSCHAHGNHFAHWYAFWENAT